MDNQLYIYNTILSIITNINRQHSGIVEELVRTTYLEVDDIHHELYATFLEKHSTKQINHPLTYLDRFCFTALIDIKKYYNRYKRVDDKLPDSYDDNIEYITPDTEDNLIELIDDI